MGFVSFRSRQWLVDKSHSIVELYFWNSMNETEVYFKTRTFTNKVTTRSASAKITHTQGQIHFKPSFFCLVFLLWRLFLLFWIEDNNDTEKRIVVVIIIHWYMTFDFDCWKWIDVCLWDRVRLGLIHNKNSASCVHFLQLWGCKILFYFSYENSCHSYKIILPLHCIFLYVNFSRLIKNHILNLYIREYFILLKFKMIFHSTI